MLNTECHSDKHIRDHSFFPNEDEVLPLAATQFKVIGCLDQAHGLHVIQLKETEPLMPRILPTILDSQSDEASSSKLKGFFFINRFFIRLQSTELRLLRRTYYGTIF